MITTITLPTIDSKRSIETFFQAILDAGCCIDPDDTYHDFIDRATGLPSFDYDTAEAIDQRMEEAMEWAEKNGIDAYELATIKQTIHLHNIGFWNDEQAAMILENYFA